jgi:hypothetical protein
MLVLEGRDAQIEAGGRVTVTGQEPGLGLIEAELIAQFGLREFPAVADVDQDPMKRTRCSGALSRPYSRVWSQAPKWSVTVRRLVARTAPSPNSGSERLM